MECACELCDGPGGRLLWQSAACRVVRVEDPLLPGFCRVIWNRHVAEMTDLDAPSRALLMRVVYAVETGVRRCFAPDKVNLASFGNVVPHLHWHVIPRWRDDPYFPNPVWGARQRDGVPPRREVTDEELTAIIASELALQENGHEQ